MKDITFTLSGAGLWICDMRPGLTEDGTSIALPRGKYRCRRTQEASGLFGMEYVIVGRSPSREEKIGGFSVDMARVGVVELAPLLASQHGDWTRLSDWSDEAADRRPTAWGGRLKAGVPHAVFFDIGGDCEVEVFRAIEGEETVGFRLRPKAPKAPPARRQRWTWVEVKMRGFGESWSFCNDWDYDPDDELIYDNIESGLSWVVKVSEHPRVPLHKLCPKIKGIDSIKVFVEEAFGQGQPSRKRLSIEIPNIAEFPTADQLRKVILRLFNAARTKG